MFQQCVWLFLCRKLIQLFDYLLHTLLREKMVLQNHLLMISLFVIPVVSQSDPIYGFKCMLKVLEIQMSESISFSEILLFIAYMICDIEDCMGHCFVLLKRSLPFPILAFTGIQHKAVCHCFWSALLTCKIADMLT